MSFKCEKYTANVNGENYQNYRTEIYSSQEYGK